MTLVSAEGEKNPLGASAKDVQVEPNAGLIASLRQVVNNPKFSDVAFVCSDGKEVRALRMLLAARSDVLSGLLINGMAESSSSKIPLPNVSSPVMLSVLEFLYTGSLLDYAPENWKMGWEVIAASKYFLLPELEVAAWLPVKKFILAAIHDLPKLASMLNEALEF